MIGVFLRKGTKKDCRIAVDSSALIDQESHNIRYQMIKYYFVLHITITLYTCHPKSNLASILVSPPDIQSVLFDRISYQSMQGREIFYFFCC